MKVLLSVLCSLFLVACASQVETKYVTQVQTVYVVQSPPKELYDPNVQRVKPPKPSVYSEKDWDEKEQLLIDHIKKLNSQIETLITDRKFIEKWIEEQNKLIQDKEKNKDKK